MFNVTEIIFWNNLRIFHCSWNNFNSVLDVFACEIRHWNNLKIFSKLDSLCWFSQHRRPESLPAAVTVPPSWDCGATWWMWFNGQIRSNVTYDCYPHKLSQGYDPQIRTRPRFLYNAPTPKFHHRVFTHSETNTQTNKQTEKKHPTFFATLQCWVFVLRVTAV